MNAIAESDAVTVLLCGDVMTGRGIDQILPHPGNPVLYEPYVRSARVYVELAERAGIPPIERPVAFDYIWGDALAAARNMGAQVRIVNLETAVTTSERDWPQKGIHYRMHPENVPCLTTFELDCCALANNHVMDWGEEGLTETLDTLRHAGIRTTGAGRDASEAAAPAVIDLVDARRVLVFAYALGSSGVPGEWRATARHPGVNLLTDLSARSVETVAGAIRSCKRSGDVAVVSLHWGPNWGFDVSPEERAFAQGLLDVAGADVVHGHSSHHVRGIEVHRGKLILYGCGDFLTDYEGIGGHTAYRGELGVMYFPTIASASGQLVTLSMTPTCMRRFRVNLAAPKEVDWLHRTLDRESRKLGSRVERNPDGTLSLRVC